MIEGIFEVLHDRNRAQGYAGYIAEATPVAAHGRCLGAATPVPTSAPAPAAAAVPGAGCRHRCPAPAPPPGAGRRALLMLLNPVHVLLLSPVQCFCCNQCDGASPTYLV